MARLSVKGILTPGASAASWRKFRVGKGMAERVLESRNIPISALLDCTRGGVSVTIISDFAPATLRMVLMVTVPLMPGWMPEYCAEAKPCAEMVT